MAVKPDTYFPWAMDYIEENITTPAGVTYENVPNKQQPAEDENFKFQSEGIFLEGMPIQYLNWQLNGWSLWWRHFDERLRVGDVIVTTLETPEEVAENKGGVWTFLGTLNDLLYYQKTG